MHPIKSHVQFSITFSNHLLVLNPWYLCFYTTEYYYRFSINTKPYFHHIVAIAYSVQSPNLISISLVNYFLLSIIKVHFSILQFPYLLKRFFLSIYLFPYSPVYYFTINIINELIFGNGIIYFIL